LLLPLLLLLVMMIAMMLHAATAALGKDVPCNGAKADKELPGFDC
jgi:hypothetical protein